MSNKIEKLSIAKKRVIPVKPRVVISRLSKQSIKKNEDVEVVFDDEESSSSEVADNVLDDYLLASRDTGGSDESDKETTTIKDKLIGSKAKLRALMHNSSESGSESGDPLDDNVIEVDDNEDEDEDNNVDEDDTAVEDNTTDIASGEASEDAPVEKSIRKAKTFVSKQKKVINKTIAIKRGPGRPPKTQKKDPIPRRGIARNPHNTDSFVEVLYDQPIIMKKIFSFFKYVAASEIQILFRPRDIIFYAVDHNGKTKIRIRVDTEKLNHYYCRDVLDVGISQKEMEMILNKVDKDYSSIVILSDVSTTRRNLTLVFENDIQIDELHRIDLIASYNKMENEQAFIDEDYTIKFNFPGRYFKKTVGDIKAMSPQLSITQEDSESPLIFEYLTINKRIQSKHTVKDSNKIKLESNLQDGESFRVDVCIDYLKPISASQISDDITILVDENKCLMTKSYIDNGTIEIKTLTEIIDERPEDDDDD